MTRARARHLAGPALYLVLAVVPAGAQTPPLDTASLAAGPGSTLRTLLERTIFQVDVLTLEVRVGPDTAAQIERLIGSADTLSAVDDSVARAVVRADDVFARIRFLRGVSQGQFLDALQGNARAARDASIISPGQYESIVRESPTWYAFLDERPIRDGDEMLYRIRGDTLRTLFRAADGELLLDQLDVGAERRLSVLGGYVAPGSDFRGGLLKSVLDPSCRRRQAFECE